MPQAPPGARSAEAVLPHCPPVARPLSGASLTRSAKPPLTASRSARQGSHLAKFRLADIYKDGIPGVVTPDLKKFASYVREAAEDGSPRAQSLLATCYVDGDGMPKDYGVPKTPRTPHVAIEFGARVRRYRL